MTEIIQGNTDATPPENYSQGAGAKEQVYDEQVYPLMSEVIKLCREHEIPMLAHFVLEGDLRVTSMVNDDGEGGAADSGIDLMGQIALKGFAAFALRGMR